MKRMIWLVVIAGGLATGCTTLGPMPATTAISAVPSGRPGIEAQVGLVPAYFLSAATQAPASTHKGNPSGQLLALVEPDRVLGARGLIAGARHWGEHGEVSIEPFLGYRHRLDDDISLALIGYGTTMRGASQGASYRASRAGGELALDARVIGPARWLALHGQAAISATYLDADGTYCADRDGFGVDCQQDATDRVINGSIRGVFGAATATAALDFGRMPTGGFHSFRIALLGSAGVMPKLVDGVRTDGARYVSFGLTLTLGLGSAE
jgi:hypothetical protein